MPTLEADQITFRDLRTIEEMIAVEELQIEVWGLDPREIVSRFTFKPAIEVGGALIGAFDRETLIGFSFGIIGLEMGRTILHSDMLAVKKEYRNLNLGFRLKLAQRERALAKGIELVTWTFDPLQSRNAYLNFAKLGVISNSYRINFYGETSSSFLHANVGTDRLWVEWLITSARVRRRIEDRNPISSANERFTGAATLVSRGDDLRPILLMPGTLNQTTLLIEIPVDMGKIQATNPTLAVEWRLATREAFTRAIDAGYSVQEFHRIDRDGSRVGVYELARAITPVQES